jgi:hypothetical protein
MTKSGTKFDIAIMICIILNMVSMAITFETETVAYSNALVYLNYIFTGIFTAECVLKLIG